jgi:hypothetical protein
MIFILKDLLVERVNYQLKIYSIIFLVSFSEFSDKS